MFCHKSIKHALLKHSGFYSCEFFSLPTLAVTQNGVIEVTDASFHNHNCIYCFHYYICDQSLQIKYL